MIRLGIIGLNKGNGHPYSMSAIFNGYDEEALQKECPFSLIKEYLPRHHRNRIFIEDARVTHIWTQDKNISESVARVSKIPNIVDDYTRLVGKVDGIILARDDIWNHYEMAEPFIKAGMPIYVDKLLAHNIENLNKFIKLLGKDYPLMAGSSTRYNNGVEKAKQDLDIKGVRTIHGVSRCTWIRYAIHPFDAISYIFGTDIKTVRNIGRSGFDIVHIRYKDGPDIILQIIEDLSLPIQFTCFSANREGHYTVALSDGPLYTDYFYSFVNMLREFVEMIRTGVRPVPFDEIIKIGKVIIAGEISREDNNRIVDIDELQVRYAY
jgi:predicted dehydrogenase